MNHLLRALSLFLFFCLLCFSVFGQSDTSTTTNYNLLWKIEKEGNPNKGYLFGTMHVYDERAFGFADSVMLALDECEIFALEIHPDTLIKATIELMIKDDTTNYYKNSMSNDEYSNFLKEFNEKNGLDFEELDNKHPLNVKTFNNSYKGNRDRKTFIDMHLYGIARTLDKNIIGLEPLENQIQTMFNFGINEAQNGYKSDSLMEKYFMNNLIETYGKGNLEGLEDFLGNGFAEDPMMVKRNIDMVQNIMRTLDESSLFSAVGAGHLIGKGSIISMLEANGYKVTKVSSTFTGIADTYKIDPSLIPWEIMVDVVGGFQINFPKNFSVLDQSIPTTTELGNDTIDVKLKLYSDLSSMQNLMISYNDYPLGFYLDSRKAVYEALEQELIEKGTVVDSSQNILHDGNACRLLRITSPGGYKAVIHIFIRGNRIYRFMNQNLNPGEKVADENLLIRTLKLLPYASSKMQQQKVEELNLPYFNRRMLKTDTIVEKNSFFKGGFNWYINDPSTGNLFRIAVYGIKDLFSIKNLDSFYVNYANDLILWSDSIVSSESIHMNGLQGHEILVAGESKEFFIRHQFWFYDKQAIIYSIYSDSTGVYCDNSNTFLSAKLFEHPNSQKTILLDKTPEILSALYSLDSITSSNALDALNYNTIDSSYTEQLEALFLQDYMTDTLHDGQSKAIVEILFEMSSFEARSLSYNIAENHNADDYLRSRAITKLYELGDTLPAIKILFDKTPQKTSYWYDIFSPFEASKKLTYDYFDQLVVSLKHKDLRSRIFGLITSFAKTEKEQYIQKIAQNYDEITSHFESKIDSISKITSSDIYIYTNFFSTYKTDKNHTFLNKIDTAGLPLYVLSSFAQARIYNDLPVDKTTLDILLSNNYFQSEIQLALLQMGKNDKLPDSLQSATSLYMSKLNSYFEEEYYTDGAASLLGTIKDVDNTTYYVYKLTEKYDNDTSCYIGLVNKTKMKDRKIYSDVKVYTAYIEQCDFKNWKQLAKNQFNDFKEYAY